MSHDGSGHDSENEILKSQLAARAMPVMSKNSNRRWNCRTATTTDGQAASTTGGEGKGTRTEIAGRGRVHCDAGHDSGVAPPIGGIEVDLSSTNAGASAERS